MTDKTDNTLDGICGAAILMGLPRATTVLIEFTGTATRDPPRKTFAPLSAASSPATESKPTAFVPSREAIDSRLDLLQKNEHVLPVEGRYWASLNDYLSEKDPEYKGEINGDKARDLGLYDSGKALVRVYKDSVTYSRPKS